MNNVSNMGPRKNSVVVFFNAALVGVSLYLTHIGRGKMAAMLHTTFSSAINIFAFRLKFDLCFVP